MGVVPRLGFHFSFFRPLYLPLIFSRLLQFMVDEGVPLDLQLECAVVLGSLAKGRESNVRALVDAGCVPILLKGIWLPSIYI
jgi:hypothetical protein